MNRKSQQAKKVPGEPSFPWPGDRPTEFLNIINATPEALASASILQGGRTQN